MKTKIKMWQLKQRQSLPLNVKIEMSKLKIRDFIDLVNDNCFVSYSGGKDSEVLLHLVKQIKPNIDIVFVDNKMELYTREHAIKKATKILYPKTSAYKVWNKYGVPFPSKQQAHYIYQVKNTKSEYLKSRLMTGIMKDGTKTMFKLADKWKDILDTDIKLSDICCEKLKREPMRRYIKETKSAPIVGTMASDSFERQKSYLQTGCLNMKSKTFTPLGFWTEQDILEYILKYKLDLAPVYGDIIKHNNVLVTTGAKRTGCVPCGFGVHLEKRPNRYERLYNEDKRMHNIFLNVWCNGALGKLCKMYNIPIIPGYFNIK